MRVRMGSSSAAPGFTFPKAELGAKRPRNADDTIGWEANEEGLNSGSDFKSIAFAGVGGGRSVAIGRRLYNPSSPAVDE